MPKDTSLRLEVETESAGRYGAATQADLHRLVNLMNEENSYLILHRTDVRGFAQAALRRDRSGKVVSGYLVEHSPGDDTMVQATVDSPEAVYEILAKWAYGPGGWRTPQDWERVDFRRTFIDVRGACDFEQSADGWRVRFRPLDLEARGTSEDEGFAELLEVLRVATQQKPMALAFSAWAKDHLVVR